MENRVQRQAGAGRSHDDNRFVQLVKSQQRDGRDQRDCDGRDVDQRPAGQYDDRAGNGADRSGRNAVHGCQNAAQFPKMKTCVPLELKS